MTAHNSISSLLTGVILAGGQASRMGGRDKGLIELFAKPLYRHVIDRMENQVGEIVINANRNISLYAQSGYPVISDSIDGFIGPLAGMLSGLEYSKTDWALFVPCDTPFIPLNLAEKLWSEKDGQLAAYACDKDRSHPTIALIHKALIPKLKLFLTNGDRKLMLFLQQCQAKPVLFENATTLFCNINTPDDCIKLEQQNENNN